MSAPSYGPLIESRCPQCHYQLTGATNVAGEGAPESGDGSICLNCGQLLIYQDDLTLRRATAKEVGQLMLDPATWAAIEKAQMIIQRRGRFA